MEMLEKKKSNRFRRLATAAAFASLFSYAATLFVTPASNNEIARTYSASLAMLARLALAIMVGFLSAVLFAGWYSDRRGKLPVIFAGCISMTLGLTIFGSAPSFDLLTIASFLMGLGGGLSESTCMALVADLYHESRRTAMANLSQASFGVGAVVSPLVVGWLLRSGINFRIGYFGTALVCAVSAAIAFAALSMRCEIPRVDNNTNTRWKSLIGDSLVMMLALGIMLYVGAEIGQSQWLAVYFRQNLGAKSELAAWSLSFMWFGILTGRVAGALVSKLISEIVLIRLCLIFSALSQSVLLLTNSPVCGLVFVFFLGFFLGPVFPTIVSCASGAHPLQSGTITSIVVAAGALGAAIFPPAIGWAADFIGLKTALWTCMAILLIDAGMFFAMRGECRH